MQHLLPNRQRFFTCLLFFSLLSQGKLWAQNTFREDHRLAKKIAALVHDFPGEVGIYEKNLRTGKGVAYH
ncbi:MAG: hypothetical protein ACYCOO_10450, partial [Chitinophagaceae bacterium]